MPSITSNIPSLNTPINGAGIVYKMLRVVFIQAIFFAAVLASLWLINPNWMFWHQEQESEITQNFKDFKQHYGALNTINLQLAQLHTKNTVAQTDIDNVNRDLSKHIQAIKIIAIPAQQYFQLDFTVLVNFLFNYRAKIQTLNPSNEDFMKQLWEVQIYFSRIQSEFFYIAEEIDRFDKERAQNQLNNAQNSLLIWGLTSFMIIILGGVMAFNYARQWKRQITQLLHQIYRLSADDYTSSNDISYTNDELGLLAKSIQEAINKIKSSKR